MFIFINEKLFSGRRAIKKIKIDLYLSPCGAGFSTFFEVSPQRVAGRIIEPVL